jgi:hypothetical protein
VAVGSAAAGVVALGMGAGRAPVDRTVAVNAASRCRAAASRVGLSTRPGRRPLPQRPLGRRWWRRLGPRLTC